MHLHDNDTKHFWIEWCDARALTLGEGGFSRQLLMLIRVLHMYKTFPTLPFCCKVSCQCIVETVNLPVQTVATEVSYVDN